MLSAVWWSLVSVLFWVFLTFAWQGYFDLHHLDENKCIRRHPSEIANRFDLFGLHIAANYCDEWDIWARPRLDEYLPSRASGPPPLPFFTDLTSISPVPDRNAFYRAAAARDFFFTIDWDIPTATSTNRHWQRYYEDVIRCLVIPRLRLVLSFSEFCFGRIISTFIILMRTNASAAALLKSPTALMYLDAISPPTIAMSGTFGHALDWTIIFPRD
jgi:hypothetical protein